MATKRFAATIVNRGDAASRACLPTTVFSKVWARTPGKLVFGTMVVIPFDALSFFGEAGWHDSIPETRVVLVRSPVK